MWHTVRALVGDESGALTTLEVIGYTVLAGGAVTLVGYGITGVARGKLGAAMNAVNQVEAMSGAVTSSSTASYALGSPDSKTGIVLNATGN